ncbi:Glutamate synthase [NADPH] small chain [Staphylococcus aureus]|nr:Glutamate synthase [NADPH] small chain [Staphylococcus aureus]
MAIVGSGPAGLTAAEELNLLGYQVTIYERARESGGLLMYGIPNMKLDKDVVRRRIKLMEEAGITFINGVEVGVDIDKATLESEYDAIILCTGAQKGRDLPLEGRMGDGIHFAMDYLTEQTQLLNGEIDDITITAKDKNVIIIGAGDTGADCVATALRENCKSIVQFNKYTKLPEAITFTENASWPLAMPVFKMDYAHQEYEAKFGKEPRAYGVQTMRYDVDDKGHIRGLYTQILEQGENGMVMKEGPERFWPADLVLLSIGFEGTEPTVPNAFNIKTDRNRIVADDTNYQTNNEKVFAAGDARRAQSLVVWGAQKGRDLPLEGRMGDGIHFAMDYLTEQTQLLNGEIDDITITAKDKNVIIIGAGDTGADCVATALRENCKSIVQFNKYTKLPEAITFTENASWPLAMPVFKMDYAHQEYEAKFGKEPRAYGVQTMRYDVDDKGHIRGLYTQILEQGENGMVMKEGPERFWPADLVLLSIGFEGTEPTVPNAFNIKTDRNRIVADDTNYQTNNEKVFAAGDARRGQSLVVWAIKEGRGVAKAVDQYLASKVCV